MVIQTKRRAALQNETTTSPPPNVRRDYYGWYEVLEKETGLLWLKHLITGEELVIEDPRIPVPSKAEATRVRGLRSFKEKEDKG